MIETSEPSTMEHDVTSENLWHDLHERLRGFIGRRVPGEHTVDDLLQEVFLRLERHLDSLDEREAVVGWVFRIAHSVIADYYRGQAKAKNIEAHLRRQAQPDAAAPASSEPPDAVAELAGCVTPFVESLPEPYAQAITLTELEGLTQAEAAERLNLSVSGMKSRVQRGRGKLREMFEACCRIEFDARGNVTEWERRRERTSFDDPTCDCR